MALRDTELKDRETPEQLAERILHYRRCSINETFGYERQLKSYSKEKGLRIDYDKNLVYKI